MPPVPPSSKFLDSLLEIRGLKTQFELETGVVRAVDGVELSLDAGETLALVGESGSGKTMLSLSVMGLVPHPGRIVDGSIRLGGRELIGMAAADLRGVRGREVAMVFQDPMTSLNPVIRVGGQIAESLALHLGLKGEEARTRVHTLLDLVGIPDPEVRAREYPHQLSGGMRQRVMIAMALACDPKVLIADEPTTALDVTIQAQILELLADIQRRTGMAMLFVTHDLGVVAETADRVAVMYAGRLVEEAETDALFGAPRMPYTAGLLASVPHPEMAAGRLTGIPGSAPARGVRPSGCAFHPRCGYSTAQCRTEPPEAGTPGPGHRVWCHHWNELDLQAATST